jgi:CheY-like chemotaxis protein
MSQVTILVVDDDEGHTELVRRNLQRSGISNPIVALTSGSEALDYVFCRGPYTERTGNGELLVLLDINMPGIDGVEVLRQIKSDANAKRIPVLMLTTTDDPREINRCYELGCNVYITKPVAPAAFIEAIQRLGLFIAVVNVPTDPAKLPK